jgi:hypothetical protein
MRQSPSLTTKIIGAVFATAFLVAAGWLFVAGSVAVLDARGRVARVEITNHRSSISLIRLPGGLFVGLPALEGVVRVRCRGGRMFQTLYVTRSVHSWQRLEGSSGC